MAKRTPNHTKSHKNKKPRDLYQEVTDTILEHLDQGVAPWRQPIRSSGGAQPTSLGSGRPYRCVNTFLLAMVAWAKGFESNHWMTDS